MEMAQLVSSWSRDPGTKVGCVLVLNKHVLSVGYNGFPTGIQDLSDRFDDRDWKLAVTVHAEVNAILNAGKHGARTEGATLYTTFPPCSNCASAIIQAGVVRVVCPSLSTAPERWKTNFELGQSLLHEVGVTISEV